MIRGLSGSPPLGLPSGRSRVGRPGSRQGAAIQSGIGQLARWRRKALMTLSRSEPGESTQICVGVLAMAKIAVRRLVGSGAAPRCYSLLFSLTGGPPARVTSHVSRPPVHELAVLSGCRSQPLSAAARALACFEAELLRVLRSSSLAPPGFRRVAQLGTRVPSSFREAVKPVGGTGPLTSQLDSTSYTEATPRRECCSRGWPAHKGCVSSRRGIND